MVLQVRKRAHRCEGSLTIAARAVADSDLARREAIIDRVAPPVFFFSRRRPHTRLQGDWSSDVCSSDLHPARKSSSVPVLMRRHLPPRRCAAAPPTPTTHASSGEAAHDACQRSLDEGAPRNQRLPSKCRSEERRVGKEGRSRWSPYH